MDFRCLAPIAALLTGLVSASPTVADEKMSFLENDAVKLGVDLNHGGAIVFLAPTGGENLINNFDLGRQVQLSFYSGPVPFESQDQKPADHWKHLGWNPVQTGDDFDNPSKVLTHENDGKTLYIKCRPMQWPLDKVPGDCIFESWLELEGPVVKGRARLTNARTDHAVYPARLQELPAVYANAAFHRVISYTADRPFTGGAVTEIPKSTTSHPWTMWQGTEGWSALLDAKDSGLGLITPGRTHFTGGFAGKPGPNDSAGVSTGYLAGQSMEILDHNIVFEYRYELVVGSLDDIRKRAAVHRPKGLPEWDFGSDRQGWYYQNAVDRGWPITEQLQISLERDDPQLISPYFIVNAAEAPLLVIEAAFKTDQKNATVYWQRSGEMAPASTDMITFPIEVDDQFHRYTIDLSAAPGYQGTVTRLRLDPVPKGAPDDVVKVKSIRFLKKPLP